MTNFVFVSFLVFVSVVLVFVEGFMYTNRRIVPVATSTTNTKLFFGIPSFLQPDSDEEDESNERSGKISEDPKLEKKKIGLEGLFQLITAGAGAPFLGDYQGVDEETGNFMFSLEANNLVDDEGNSKQTSMPYFESGWVDEDEEEKKQGGGFKLPWQK